ncbi:MAG: hypothetical protein HYY06_19330 [Deltaproteobacteria bacterium]|nr:hypothetical protein [Deltaproteobacteria bacterium]
MSRSIQVSRGLLVVVALALMPALAAAQPEEAPPEGEPAAPAAPAEAAPAAPATPGTDAGSYAVRLRDLEQRINELKEQIFRSKARLSLLAETVLSHVIAGAKAVLVHRNEMGSSFKLVKAVFTLDGAPIFNKVDEEGNLGEQEERTIFDGSIVPGEHNLSVSLEYRGHGYGIFSYLRGYRFTTRASQAFTAAEGKTITVKVIGYERGDPTTPLEDRPSIRFNERVSAGTGGTRTPTKEGGAEE